MNKGTIKEIREDGTAVIVASINTAEFIRKNIKECYVDYIDSRPLSDKQRRMCYALTNAIAEWSGEDLEMVHLDRKFNFTMDRAEEFPELTEKLFSLSNASMSLIREYQKYLIKFVLNNDIPTKRPLLEYVDDINDYVYSCLINKKCAVCGRRKAELNHIDTIGMGNDRTEVQHEGREAISLCTDHHKEYHTMGKASFFEKYHFNGGIKIDKTILKIYGLRR